MTLTKRLSALLFLFILAPLAQANPPDAQTLLDKMIAAYGGQAALEKLNAYQQTWRIDAVSRGDQGTDRRAVELPDRLRVELVYPARSELRILDGDKGLKVYDGTNRQPATGPGLDAMRLQRMRLYHPLIIKAKASDIKGIDEKDGFYRLTLAEGTLLTEYFINPTNHLIEQVTGHLSMGGATMSFHTEYHDYKAVAGVMLPHREVKFAGNVNTAIMTLEETRFEAAEAGQFEM